MIPIYLCEDDPCQLSQLKSIIEKYLFIENLHMKVVCACQSPEELLKSMPRFPQAAVYFLDIQLESALNGIELAARIRALDPRAFVVFTTTHSEMAVTTFRYKVEPLDFLIKDDPDYSGRIVQCLENILEKSRVPAVSSTGRLQFRLPEQELFLPVDDILYIRSTGAHRIAIYTAGSVYQCPGALKETQEKLGDHFFPCHKSFLVNVLHIRKLMRSPCRMELDNGAICPCAQRRFRKLQQIMESLSCNAGPL